MLLSNPTIHVLLRTDTARDKLVNTVAHLAAGNIRYFSQRMVETKNTKTLIICSFKIKMSVNILCLCVCLCST